MYRLIATVKRGSASNLPLAVARYATVDAARAAAVLLLKEERVVRIMLARAESPSAFVEWLA